ncbi:sulfotransferase family 2 domain-containing protein [Microbulbifer thermotolerans]|uniref:sulfotransferase family 2 domain-containing protein n=1 Tax=Microbulbifer thermotolerans TaxID=252514 RepID=UPI00224B34FA|nr:sulfotransferase family 2 domain-containing protein [Microbulbifer thermotolerans]MCX2780158.1 sulfotransferase family protein [Microbulbifer thermotolerans]MCX2805582.1 sulfotransferase family protein [Microbulbifer thermotolerans]
MDPLIFIHIPKTAGTSFRLGMDAVIGEERVCRDYGASSVETSPIVKQWVKPGGDLWQFGCAFRAAGYQFLTGHFHAIRYAGLFDVAQMVTFLRDPVQRVVSEYQHHVRNYGYQESLETFYRQKPNINRQQRLLGGVPWVGLGFIGITERYAESVGQFNRKFGFNVPILDKNQSRDSIAEPYRLTESQKTELERLNAEDIRLYRTACEQLDWRIRLEGKEQGYVAGAFMREERGRLLGWARAERGDDPVVLRLHVDGKPFIEVKACEYRPLLREKGVGRGGFLGFSVDITDLPKGAQVECTVAETGQPLVGSPWILKK